MWFSFSLEKLGGCARSNRALGWWVDYESRSFLIYLMIENIGKTVVRMCKPLPADTYILNLDMYKGTPLPPKDITTWSKNLRNCGRKCIRGRTAYMVSV